MFQSLIIKNVQNRINNHKRHKHIYDYNILQNVRDDGNENGSGLWLKLKSLNCKLN